MTARTSITQAMLERAIRAAQKHDCAAVEVTPDAIRIVVREQEAVPLSPHAKGENTCDGLFGGSD